MDMLRKLRSINTADVFVLITILFSAFFIVKFFGLKSEFVTIKIEVIKNNWIDNYDIYGYRVPFWLSDKVKVGQKEKDKSGKVIATLMNVENYDRGGEESELYLTLKVKTVLNKRTGLYMFKNKPLNLGSEVEFVLDNIYLKGQIIEDKVPENVESKWFLVTARGRNFDSWVYNQVKPGLVAYNKADGEPIAEIINVKIEDSTLQQVIPYGSYLKTITGKNKDVLIKVKVKAQKKNNNWYYCGHQNLKVAGSIYIYTDEINLYGLEIQEVKELSN